MVCLLLVHAKSSFLAFLASVAHLSAYMTEHLQRFGEYTLKLRPVASLSDQEKTFTDSHSEQSEASEEMSA